MGRESPISNSIVTISRPSNPSQFVL